MPKVVTVAGHQVTLRDRFPGKFFYPLHAAIRWWGTGHQMGERSFEEDVKPYVGTVLAWDWPGDPEKLEAWADLDVLTEIPLLITAINDHLGEVMEQAFDVTKNSNQPPTSP